MGKSVIYIAVDLPVAMEIALIYGLFVPGLKTLLFGAVTEIVCVPVAMATARREVLPHHGLSPISAHPDAVPVSGN